MKLETKLNLAFSSLVICFLIAEITFSLYLSALRTDVEELLEIHVASSNAAMEMEINLIGTGFGLLGYLHDRDPKHLARMKKDRKDFARFMRESAELAISEEAGALDKKMLILYEEFAILATDLTQLQDKLTEITSAIEQVLVDIDEVLDEKIQANIDPEEPHAIGKAQAALEMEINTNELVKGLANYLWTPEPQYIDAIDKDTEDFRKFLEEYKALPLSVDEREWSKEVEIEFEQIASLSKELIAINQKMGRQLARFISLRREMDVILDEGIQILTQRELFKAKTAAINLIDTNINLNVFSVAVSIALAWALAFLLCKNITSRLKEVTEAVKRAGSEGSSFRVKVHGNDEFTELGNELNNLASRMENANQAITEQLAESEHRRNVNSTVN